MKKMTAEILVFTVVAVSLSRAMAADPVNGSGKRTHLVGLDGLCLDSGGSSRYNFPKLVPCKAEEETQQWTILNDGTIRWSNNDRCLFAYGKEVFGKYILVKTGDCNELKQEDKTWSLNKNGTLLHLASDLVLTVQNYSHFVSVETNRNSPSQIWDAPDQHLISPYLVHIMGLHSYECLWFHPGIMQLILHTCKMGYGDRRWAFFDDGTIRPNTDRSLCITSFQKDPYYVVAVFKCQGDHSAEQRWELNLEDATIHHPNSSLVMDVITIEMPPSRPQLVILFSRNGAATQQWTFV